jgi:thymidylate synthase ThyX
MMELTYLPKNALRVCEYAARTCWQSHEMKKNTGDQLVSNVVKMGHESVIEHAQCIIKLSKSEYSAGTILRAINNTGDDTNATLVMANLVEGDKSWFLGLNMRGLKNIIRNADDSNLVRKNLISIIVPQLPSPFFADFIRDGVIEPYTNLIGMEQPYYTLNRKSKFHFLTDLKDLENELKSLLLSEPELTVNKLSKLVTITMRVVGPRWMITQLLRHRGAVSQESLRYVTGKEFGYLTPASIKGKTFKVARHIIDINCSKNTDEVLEMTYDDIMEFLSVVYSQGEGKGIKGEDMRNALPLSTESEAVFTKPINMWGHTYGLRLEKHTQLDTRILMTFAYLLIFDGGYPLITSMMGDLRPLIKYEDLTCLDDTIRM